MPQTRNHKQLSATMALFAIVIASLALAACGSSSSGSPSTSTSTSANATKSGTAAGKGTVPPAVGARFTAIRACMSKNGITLPQRPKSGQRPAPGSFAKIPGVRLPKGMTQAQYLAIVKKCGFGIGPGRVAGGGGFLRSASAKQALAKFASCMRENGVNIPAPNTSGSGPVFSSKGLDTSSPKFQAAETKCRAYLRNTLRARPGAGKAAPGSPPNAP